MQKFRVDFFTEDDGTKSVAEFIKSLNKKLGAKVISDLNILEEYGNLAREPLSKYLEDGIFEIRSKSGNDIARILYFFDKNRIIIATNGFVKKQQKTPRKEIDIAKERRTIYFLNKNDTEEGSDMDEKESK